LQEVLERYSVFLGDEEFDDLCKPLISGNRPDEVAYKPFLAAVLVKPTQAGAFGPHVPAPWMRRAAMAREEALLGKFTKTAEINHRRNSRNAQYDTVVRSKSPSQSCCVFF